MSLPSVVTQFNAKPVLVTKSCTMQKRGMPEVLELSFDVRQWAYVARQSLVGYRGLLKQAVVHIGYLVEGKAEDELPEQILAHFRIHFADVEQTRWIPSP